jgi:nicotinamidase/pyrazinamidase
MITKSINLMPSDPRCALLVIDMQYDFMPGGALAVAEGDALVPLINRLGALFRNVVITQDWHPAGHISFAASHAGRAPFDSITLPYGPQTLWPEHCVQGTHGAALHADLAIDHAQLVLRKGCNAGIDSYSAFVEADRTTQTGLAGYLKERGIDSVFVVGLALDFCVALSALDARAAGFNTWIVADACKAINLNGSLDKAWKDLQAAGVVLIKSTDLSA